MWDDNIIHSKLQFSGHVITYPGIHAGAGGSFY